MLNTRASCPWVVKRSLYRSPCGVRSLRDKFPKFPCIVRSPSVRQVNMEQHYYLSTFLDNNNQQSCVDHTDQAFPAEQTIWKH